MLIYELYCGKTPFQKEDKDDLTVLNVIASFDPVRDIVFPFTCMGSRILLRFVDDSGMGGPTKQRIERFGLTITESRFLRSIGIPT